MNKHLSMRTANPALQSDTFRKAMSGSTSDFGVMTINGVVNKTGLSLLLLEQCVSCLWTYHGVQTMARNRFTRASHH